MLRATTRKRAIAKSANARYPQFSSGHYHCFHLFPNFPKRAATYRLCKRVAGRTTSMDDEAVTLIETWLWIDPERLTVVLEFKDDVPKVKCE